MIDFDDDEGVSIVESYVGDRGFRFPDKPYIETADELEFMSSTFILANYNWCNDPRIDEW